MLHLTKISEADHQQLTDFLKEKMFLPVFFFSPFTLITWLTHRGRNLYIAQMGNEKILVVHKEKRNDIRFLFTYPSDEMLTEVTNHFKPNFIAANELVEIPPQPFIEDEELVVNIEAISNLNDKDIEKEYQKCVRRHPHLRVEQYSEQYKESVKIFIEAWNHTRSEEKNKFAKTENDLHFLDIYGSSPDVMGIVVLDGERVVGISFLIPALDGNAIGIINKSLRGYVQLGMFVSVQRAKRAQAMGYKKMYIGNINNEFKKRFVPSGELYKTYCREILRAPNFEADERYVLRVF